jgi:citrate lyase beta subunit
MCPRGKEVHQRAARNVFNHSQKLVVSQVESKDMILELERQMVECGAPSKTAIGALIETPMGVLRAAEVCDTSALHSASFLHFLPFANELT